MILELATAATGATGAARPPARSWRHDHDRGWVGSQRAGVAGGAELKRGARSPEMHFPVHRTMVHAQRPTVSGCWLFAVPVPSGPRAERVHLFNGSNGLVQSPQ